MELLLATTNSHKIREFREILGAKTLEGVDLLGLQHFPNYTPPPEDGDSFEAIAGEKALSAARATGKLTLAEDSGLVVPRLGGAPGIRSARYAGERATSLENCRKLLQEMEGIEGIERSAYFICALALADPQEGILALRVGTCEGEIIHKMQGGSTFGYDPLFRKHEYQKTFAEIDPSLKNRISHRAKAVELLRPLLEKRLAAR